MHGHNQPIPTQKRFCTIRLVESRWTLGGEDLLAGGLGDAMWEWELEVLGEELLDVWALDIISLLELNDLEDLDMVLVRLMAYSRFVAKHTWMERKRERWRAAISW